MYVTLMAAQDPWCEVLCEKSTSYRGSALFRCTTTRSGVSTLDGQTATLSTQTVTRKASLFRRHRFPLLKRPRDYGQDRLDSSWTTIVAAFVATVQASCGGFVPNSPSVCAAA